MTRSVSSAQASELLTQQLDERLLAPTYCWGKSWGFPTLDKWTGGVHPGEMTTLIARSGVGKSAIAGKMALTIARQFRDEGKNEYVRIVSLEMDSPSYQQRMACFMSGVPGGLVRAGFPGISQDTRSRMVSAYKASLVEIANLPIQYVEDEINLTTIQRFIESTNGGKQCGFWVLDHIGLVPGISEQYQTSSIGNMFHTMRKLCRYTAPGLILSQMNRKADERPNKRPMMADAYGSMYAEADSVTMLGLYREDIYVQVALEKQQDRQPAELIILKQRNGQLGTINLMFDPQRVDFREDTELNVGK